MAEDLLHDGFLKFFDSFDKFTWRGEGSLRAWLERVMINTVLQYLRKNDVMNHSTALENVPEVYEEPEQALVETIPQKVLMQFIRELPPGYRTVFNLYVFEEKTQLPQHMAPPLSAFIQQLPDTIFSSARAICAEEKPTHERNSPSIPPGHGLS